MESEDSNSEAGSNNKEELSNNMEDLSNNMEESSNSMEEFQEYSALPMIFTLSWDDIWLPEILSMLSLEDLFRLRGSCKPAYQLVNTFFTQIKKLDLTNKRTFTLEAYQIVVGNGYNLRHLILSGAKCLTNDSLKETFVQHTRNLETVDLSECHSVTAACLQPLAVQCKQLKRLVLKDCHWVTRASMEYMAHHQTSIITINLTGCWELVDKTIVQLLASFRQLRFVSVANIYSLTDQTMNALAHYTGPNLIALDVRGCWRITDRGVAVVSEYCPNLRVLNVTDCRDVSEHSLTRLRQRQVQIDRQLNPLHAARLRLDERLNGAPGQHPDLRLQV